MRSMLASNRSIRAGTDLVFEPLGTASRSVSICPGKFGISVLSGLAGSSEGIRRIGLGWELGGLGLGNPFDGGEGAELRKNPLAFVWFRRSTDFSFSIMRYTSWNSVLMIDIGSAMRRMPLPIVNIPTALPAKD
jgi:hypothetical protein